MGKAYRFIRCEFAVTSIEYALIASLIAIVIIVALSGVGGNLAELYNQLMTSIASALS